MFVCFSILSIVSKSKLLWFSIRLFPREPIHFKIAGLLCLERKWCLQPVHSSFDRNTCDVCSRFSHAFSPFVLIKRFPSSQQETEYALRNEYFVHLREMMWLLTNAPQEVMRESDLLKESDTKVTHFLPGDEQFFI